MPQEIVVFHSAYGLRPAILGFAETLRAAGHTVHTPDLFDGAVFSTLEEGVAQRDSLGIEALMGRAFAAVDGLPEGLVYAGFSMGIGPAVAIAAARPGARGVVLLHGAFDPAEFGIDWPAGVPAQLHYARGDAETDAGAVEALVSAVRAAGATAETHVYDGNGHLFADDGLPDYDAAAASEMQRRVVAFLERLG